MACSIAGALEAIGDRWAVLILRDLGFGLSRYEDLRRSTGATHATLSDRLRHLEDSSQYDVAFPGPGSVHEQDNRGG